MFPHTSIFNYNFGLFVGPPSSMACRQQRPRCLAGWGVEAGFGGPRVIVCYMHAFLLLLFAAFGCIGEEMRAVEQVASWGPSEVSVQPKDYSLAEVQQELETHWPASAVFDFDAALKKARKGALRPLGLWGIEALDSKEMLRLLNLQMERFVAQQFSKAREASPLLASVPLLSDWDVLLLARQQLTRDRVKTKLSDLEVDDIFRGAPRLYPWLPRDVCDWGPQGASALRRLLLPVCILAEGPLPENPQEQQEDDLEGLF